MLLAAAYRLIASHLLVCCWILPPAPPAPSIPQVYSSDEVFVTGTFSGQIPVREVDGRIIGSGQRGPMVARLQQLYAALCDEQAARGRVAISD